MNRLRDNTAYTKIRRTLLCAVFIGFALLARSARAQIQADMPDVAAPGQSLTLEASDAAVTRWRVLFDGHISITQGPELSLTLRMGDAPTLCLLLWAEYGDGNVSLWRQDIRSVPPREALLGAWMRAIAKDDGTLRRADSVTAPGQCKQYLINQFQKVSGPFALAAYPEASLYMPAEHNDPKTTKRAGGSAWTLPEAQTGNPFYEAARYDYQAGSTLRANKEAARALLESVQPGDVLQMMAVYNNGVRGTHTILLTAAYDAQNDRIYWSDSNFRMRNIDGVRHAYVVARQERKLDEVIGWLVQRNCGATLYRLSEDVVLRVVP